MSPWPGSKPAHWYFTLPPHSLQASPLPLSPCTHFFSLLPEVGGGHVPCPAARLYICISPGLPAETAGLLSAPLSTPQFFSLLDGRGGHIPCPAAKLCSGISPGLPAKSAVFLSASLSMHTILLSVPCVGGVESLAQKQACFLILHLACLPSLQAPCLALSIHTFLSADPQGGGSRPWPGRKFECLYLNWLASRVCRPPLCVSLNAHISSLCSTWCRVMSLVQQQGNALVSHRPAC